jgi:fructose-1,6-bisphosphatase/inositol monophosphatase family enzyme
MPRKTEQQTRREIARALRRVHAHIRDASLAQCRATSMDELARIAREEQEDACFNVDLQVERLLPELLERELGSIASFAIVFEGQGDGPPLVIPDNVSESSARYRAIIDPIDGSRGIAYQLRSAWILTAVADNHGPATSIREAHVAVKTEIPLVNQRRAAVLSVVRGDAIAAESVDVDTGASQPLNLAPSPATSIENGYVGSENYFDGPSVLLAELEERLIQRVLGVGAAGAARVWHDTYISSGGVVYNLLSGRLRWAHDLRPVVRRRMESQGLAMSLTAHPYDLCTAPLLAAAVGVPITDAWGEPLDVPMTLHDDVAWVGYANDAIRRQVEPELQAVLREFTTEEGSKPAK